MTGTFPTRARGTPGSRGQRSSSGRAGAGRDRRRSDLVRKFLVTHSPRAGRRPGRARTVHDLGVLCRRDRVAGGGQRPVRDRGVVVEVAAADREPARGVGGEARRGGGGGQPRVVARQAQRGREPSAAGEHGEGGRGGARARGLPGEVDLSVVVGSDEGGAYGGYGVERAACGRRRRRRRRRRRQDKISSLVSVMRSVGSGKEIGKDVKC